MKNILILYNNWDGKCITGGQFYEDYMYKCMSENPKISVTRIAVNRKNSIVNKLFAPIINLKYISKCKKYDIVIFNSSAGWHFLLLSLILRISSSTKVIVIHHHFIYESFAGIKRHYYKIIEDLFLQSSNIIVTVSPYINKLCTLKYPKKNIRLWPIPFSNRIIDCKSDRKKGQLVFMGTIDSRKGLIYLINALVILKQQNIDVTLKIIGKIKNESYYEELVKIITNHHLDVYFLGFIDNISKDQILKESDIFVFPSLLEGYGMVLREVMSYGLPIVCFDNSAMPYLVENGINGFVVENKNHIKMAEAILKIIENPELRQRLSEGSYDYTKKTITHDMYKDLLNKELEII